MKMLKVTQSAYGNELLLNPAFIVSMEQSHYSTEVIVTKPNSRPKTYVIKEGIDLIENNLAPIKMLRLKMKQTEHELLLNPAFIISAEREGDHTEIILSSLDASSITFHVSAGVALIEERLASI